MKQEYTNTDFEKISISLLGVPVDLFTKAELSIFILKILRGQKRGWVSYINIHTIDIANQLPWYKQFQSDALIRYCDGEGVRVGAYLLGKHIPARFTLSHYINDLAALAVEQDINIFLLGGTPDVAELSAKRLKELYPTIRLSGYHHGFFSVEENSWMVKKIVILDVNETETTYTVKDIKLNTNMKDKTFTFETPEGAEVVDLR